MAEEKKTIKIFVNTIEKTVEKDQLTYAEVVALAFNPVPSGPNIVITVVYRKGDEKKPEGSLEAGQSVKAKNGMIFNVTATDKS